MDDYEFWPVCSWLYVYYPCKRNGCTQWENAEKNMIFVLVFQFQWLDKRTNELAIVVKDIRALRDSFEPWLDEVWWKSAWPEIKNSIVLKNI